MRSGKGRVLAQEKNKACFLSCSEIPQAMNVAVKSNLNEVDQVLFFKLSNNIGFSLGYCSPGESFAIVDLPRMQIPLTALSRRACY